MCCSDEQALYFWVQWQGCGDVDGTAVRLDALKTGLEAAMGLSCFKAYTVLFEGIHKIACHDNTRGGVYQLIIRAD